MAIQTIDQLKTWFLTSLKPTQQQFHDWLDSYWHRNDKLPIDSVDKLSETLDNKADKVHVHSMGDVDGLDGKFNDQYLYFNNAVNDEIIQRKEADKAIQDEVDSLKKITMIRGNVDTYADLLTLDTSSIREGDSYIVEKDETREGKSTLYVWSAGSWVYTGEWASGGGTKPPLATVLATEMQLNGYCLLYADCSESMVVSIQDLPIGTSVVIMINVLSISVGVSFTDEGTIIPTIGKIDEVGKYTVTILKFNKTNIRCNIAKYE